MTHISRLTNEFQNHRFIYTALIILHIILILTNGFGSGFQNPTPEVEAELVYGSPINQNVGQEVNITDVSSVTEVLLVNQTPYTDRFDSYLPIHDCEIIEFNASIDVQSGTAGVSMWLRLYSRGEVLSVTFEKRLQEGLTTITLQITEQMTQNYTWHFLDRISADILPLSNIENILIQSFTGKAIFTRELCPVTIDILTTDNFSLLDFNPGWSSSVFPVLNLSQENTNQTNNYLYPWFLIDAPLYLEPGNYSGDIYWSINWHSFNMLPVEFEIEQDQGAKLSVRILAVRIDMTNEPNLPSYYVYINDELFRSGGTNATLPNFVYIPPFNTTIVIHSFVEDQNDLTAFHTVPYTYIYVNGSYNLLYTLQYPYPVIQNIVFTPYQLGLLLYLPSLYILLLTRFVTLVEPHAPKRTWLNPRIVPVLVILLTAVTPWYTTSKTRSIFYGSGQYSVINSYYFPLLFYTIGTDGSVAIPYLPDNLSIFILPFIFYWVPLFYAASRVRVSWVRETNTAFSLALLSMVILSGFFGFEYLRISGLYPFPGPGLIISALACGLWIVGLLWMHVRRKNLMKTTDSST